MIFFQLLMRKSRILDFFLPSETSFVFPFPFLGTILPLFRGNNAKTGYEIMADKKITSYPKEKINILFLENISDAAVKRFSDGGLYICQKVDKSPA